MEEAKELTDYQKFLMGITILNGYPDPNVFAEHDVFGVGVDADLSQEDECILTEELDWHWSDEYDCWCFFV